MKIAVRDWGPRMGRRIARGERILKLFVELATDLLVRSVLQPESDRSSRKEFHE